MKVEYKQGWYKVRPCGLRYEVTYFDGRNTYCEDVRKTHAQAVEYCKSQIDNHYSGV